MRVSTCLLCMMLSFVGVNLMSMTGATAQSPATTTEAPSGNIEKTIKKDPVCDPTYRPKITKIEPDEFQAGDKVTIMGEHFGEIKECLHEVTFGVEKAKDFKLVGNEKIEATAPDNVSTGMIFVNVVTGGGAARSAVLVKKKE